MKLLEYLSILFGNYNLLTQNQRMISEPYMTTLKSIEYVIKQLYHRWVNLCIEEEHRSYKDSTINGSKIISPNRRHQISLFLDIIWVEKYWLQSLRNMVCKRDY